MYRLKKFIVERYEKRILFINGRFCSYSFTKDMCHTTHINIYNNNGLFKQYKFDVTYQLYEYIIYKAIEHMKRICFENECIKSIEYTRGGRSRKITYSEDGTIQHDWYRR